MKKMNTKLGLNILLIFIGILVGLIIIEITCQLTGLALSYPSYRSAYLEKSFFGTRTILILGESTSADLGLDSWPIQLESMLNNESGNIRYTIINKAKVGTSSAFLISNLESYIQEYHPDAVLTMMGTNDAFSYVYYAGSMPKKENLLLSQLKIVKLFYYLKSSIINRFVSMPSYIEDFKPMKIIAYPKDPDSGFANKKDFSKHLLELAYYRWNMREYNKSLNLALNSIYHNNYDHIGWELIGQIYFELGDFNLSNKAFQNVIKLSPENSELAYQYLLLYEDNGNRSEIRQKIFAQKGLSYDNKIPFYNITKMHYRMLYNLTSKNNITLFIMQYPRRDIADFEKYYSEEEAEKIIFIENKENFEKEILIHGYDYLFVDKFAFQQGYGFGHCTPYGNYLIAKNAVYAIIDHFS